MNQLKWKKDEQTLSQKICKWSIANDREMRINIPK